MNKWKIIDGFPNYMISIDGEVLSIKRNKLLKISINNSGYTQVCLSNGKRGSQKVFGIHKLVAIAFIPNPNNYNEINHLDLDKTNNHPDNLEWCDHKQNMEHYKNNGGTNYKIHDCPWCNYSGKSPAVFSTHFDYCKKNPNRKKIPRTYDKVTCPHCNKIGARNIMTRYHFDNCKLKSKI